VSLRRAVKRTVSGWVARLARRPRADLAAIRAARPRRVLVVRQHNQMGDMVCATPALRSIARTFPEAELALVCAPVNREVVLHNPHVDRVLVFDKRACTRPGPLWRFLRELRAFRPDVAVVLNTVSFSVTSAALAAASGARWLVGSDSAPYGFDISRHAYSLVLPASPVMDRHAVRHQLDPLLAAGFVDAGDHTEVVPSREEREAAARLLAALPGDAPPWVVHPGAGKRENLWPTARFAAVVRRALAAGRTVLVLQGPADGVVTDRLRRELPAPDGGAARWRVNPPVPVGVCAAVLERADRFLCNDTGLMHVAGAVGAPTLALFGPTDPALWAPRSPRLRALRAADGRLASLDVDTVWDAWCGLPGRDTTDREDTA